MCLTVSKLAGVSVSGLAKAFRNIGLGLALLVCIGIALVHLGVIRNPFGATCS
jgi:hypothetical protein